MQHTREQISPTNVKLTISADQQELQTAKAAALEQLGHTVKVPGFRPGTAPLAMIEKHFDQSLLQNEVINQTVNSLYSQAIAQENMRPVAQPTITLSKFVPYTDLEFLAEVEAVGEVTLPDYKKIKVSLSPIVITAKEVNDVLKNLRERAAAKNDVERAAKHGDEVLIDFTGVAADSGEAIAGADGKDYPLVLGSGTFIPGFESKLLGATPGAVKTFTLTFPKDYGVSTLQDKQVAFTVTVHKIRELQLPAADDDFAKTVGPFKDLKELKADIKRQLSAEREREARQQYINEYLSKVGEKTDVAIPEALIEEEIDRMEAEEKQNLAYRGQTWEEHLAEEGVTLEAHRAGQRPSAEQRVKAGLILGEIANHEDITVSPEELEVRIQLLKGQYQDPSMQAELDKSENRRDLHSRMMTEKTFDYLLTLQAPAKK